MPKQKKTKVSVEEIESLATSGKSVSQFFVGGRLKDPVDSIERRPKKEIQTVNIDFPMAFLSEIDSYSASLNIPRASAIKTLIREALDRKQTRASILREPVQAWFHKPMDVAASSKAMAPKRRKSNK